MAIVGWEWIVILAVLAMFLVWGPDKIPKVARAIGQARREFEEASRQASGALAEPPRVSSDDILLATARDLGIETAGKTRQEISAEIVAKGQQKSYPPNTLAQPQDSQVSDADKSGQAETAQS